MYLRNCLNCNKEFETNNNIKIFCCSKCAKQFHNKNRYSLYNKICPIFNNKFNTKYKKQIYCSIKCLNKFHNSKRYKLKKYVLKCVYCGKDFIANSKIQKYCSEQCRKEMYKIKSKQYNNNPYYKISHAIRHQMNLKIRNKKFHTFEILNYNNIELKHHLESLFIDGMNWNNYGGKYGWQIDHIKPVASFNIINEDGSPNFDEIRKCWALENLQPLWAKDNNKKGSKFNNILYRKNKRNDKCIF